MRRILWLLLVWLIISPWATASQPNILWLVNEDHGPHVGAYGDTYATTPTFDALAAKGLRYSRCWSNAPVCAPARTTLICGLYACSTGGEHMRSMVPFPVGKKMYPELMREAGYYCTNNAKEDYNLEQPKGLWDASSKKAHWRNRPTQQPFLAVFNSEKSHESQLRIRPHVQIHDPAAVRIPGYHPDTPEVRLDWAQYYDTVSAADADAGARLKELEADGLTEETIIFYYADHGSGMPFNKRWPYNRGLQVPLIVYIPEKYRELWPPEYQPGGVSDRMVSFVDFAPTLLSLAGVKPPDWLQGHAFLGHFVEKPQAYLFGFRGRMDERGDLVRTLTDGRFVYVRNFRPDRIYGQHINYLWQTPTTRIWERMFQEGKLNPAQSAFWKPKAAEELYDLVSDRDEIVNLAAEPRMAAELGRCRSALAEHEAQIRDVGLLPEGEMHRRSLNSTPYDLAHDEARFPFARIYAMALLASSGEPGATDALKAGLSDDDSGVRYWAVLGLAMRGRDAVHAARVELLARLEDSAPDVKIAAAEALARNGSGDDLAKTLPLLVSWADWSKNDFFAVLASLQALDALGPKVQSLAEQIRGLPRTGVAPHPRYQEYIARLMEAFDPPVK